MRKSLRKSELVWALLKAAQNDGEVFVSRIAQELSRKTLSKREEEKKVEKKVMRAILWLMAQRQGRSQECLAQRCV